VAANHVCRLRIRASRSGSGTRSAAKAGLRFTELSNGFAACDQPEALQDICDRLGAGSMVRGPGHPVMFEVAQRPHAHPGPVGQFLLGESGAGAVAADHRTQAGLFALVCH
jgi:hypothetical protein